MGLCYPRPKANVCERRLVCPYGDVGFASTIDIPKDRLWQDLLREGPGVRDR